MYNLVLSNNEGFEKYLITDYIVYVVIATILVVISIYILSKNKRKRKKDISIKVTDELIKNILDVITVDNIIKVSSDTSRVKFEVKDLEIINLEKLKSISTGVFVTGNTIKVMFQDSADEIVEKLNSYL